MQAVILCRVDCHTMEQGFLLLRFVVVCLSAVCRTSSCSASQSVKTRWYSAVRLLSFILLPNQLDGKTVLWVECRNVCDFGVAIHGWSFSALTRGMFLNVYFPVLLCLSVSVKWLAVKTASEMTYTVSGGALNSTHSLTRGVRNWMQNVCMAFCHRCQLLPRTIIGGIRNVVWNSLAKLTTSWTVTLFSACFTSTPTN